jgi:hypothetical protein
MSNQVDVRSVEALEGFEESLGRAQDGLQEFLATAKAQVSTLLDWINDREHEAQRNLSRAEERLEWARSGLADCQDSGSYDDEEGPPDCSSWEDEVSFAQREMNEALDRLDLVRRVRDEMRGAAEDFLGGARELRTVSDERMRLARLYLQAKSRELHAYLSVASPVGATGFASSPHASDGTTGIAFSTGLPASRHVVERKSRFAERGVVPVSLDDIPAEALGFLSKDDFRKYSYDQMLNGVRRFDREVRPAVEAGQGRDYFRAKDREVGVDYQHGLERLYDAFYGSEPIRVTKLKSGRYDVTNGRHRLFVAKQAGLRSLPMRVSEETTDT